MSENQLTLFDPLSDRRQNAFREILQELDCATGPGWPDRFGKSLYERTSHAKHKSVRTLSLFTGAGGLDIGFHDAGFRILEMIEIDERFSETLCANTGPGEYLGESKVSCMDIRDYTPPSEFKVDFIIGGPPCQTFSAAGRRAAGVAGTTDRRGKLFEEYVRLLRRLNPQGFLFENVYGLTGAENGQALEKIRQAFQAAGYAINWRILDAADYGVPQHRERFFIVGTKGAPYLFPAPTHGPDSPGEEPYYKAKETIDGVALTEEEKNAGVGGRFGYLLGEIPPGLNYSFFTEKMGHPRPLFAWRSKFSDFLYKADPNSPIRTLKAQGGQYTGPFHWSNRPFSVNELKRLQTIPDAYEIAGGKQLAVHQIGNSVPPQLARILALSILKQIFHIVLPFELPHLALGQRLGFRKRKRLLTSLYLKKARIAISANGHRDKPKSAVRTLRYVASLTRGFGWERRLSGHRVFEVASDVTPKIWRVRIQRVGFEKKPAFTVKITPSRASVWSLDVQEIELSGGELAEDVFTAAWKAFEAELAASNVKADIVQLSGYYQYRPAFTCALRFRKTPDFGEWRILREVVGGVGVRAILSLKELSDLWDATEAETQRCAVFLRRLGYEVRNHSTNAQIPSGHFLIPYCFPTLNPLSVQLRKPLELQYA